MSPVEEFVFLDPWDRVLPDRGVVGIAGSGGCTSVLLAAVGIWQTRGRRVLISQTTDHPVPFDFVQHVVEPEVDVVRTRLDMEGLAFVAGGVEGVRRSGLDPDLLEHLRRDAGADILVVQAQASSGHLLRVRSVPPVWPRSLGLAILVAQVGAAGRLWTAATGDADTADTADTAESSRRVEVDDLLRSLGPLLDNLPEDARPLPFLTGLGAWRDLDGMFSIVQELWQDPRVWVVALAELIGDERREAADLRDLPAHVDDPFANGRVYAVYPASLDAD
jgi:hypothetical protein